MPNKGTLELTLLGVDGTAASDPSTFVTFIRTPTGEEIGRARVSFPPSPRLFTLPAFPQERATACIITPERYRHREVGIFTLMDGETIIRQPNVFRLPHRWQPSFTNWTSLPASFERFKDLLGASGDLRLKDGATRRLLGSFTADTYDAVDPADRIVANAKATLLNVFAKLEAMKEPVFARKSWFRFLTRVVEISRERLIALVDPELLVRVTEIHANIDQYDLYKRTPVGDHHKNVPPGFTVRRPEMVSIKSRDEHGNIQLTVSPGTDAAGEQVVILDVDIDENGRLMAHLGDLFKHKFTGGTHPFDIHEFLRLEEPGRDLGYTLV